MVQGAKLALENGGGNPDSALLNPALKECLYIKTTCMIYHYVFLVVEEKNMKCMAQFLCFMNILLR